MSESYEPFHPLSSMLAFWELLSHFLVWREQKPFHLGGRQYIGGKGRRGKRENEEEINGNRGRGQGEGKEERA